MYLLTHMHIIHMQKCYIKRQYNGFKLCGHKKYVNKLLTLIDNIS